MSEDTVAVGEEGGGAVENNPGDSAPSAWYGEVTETIAPHQNFLSQFKDQESFIKSAADTKAALSRKLEGLVRIPGEDSPPEDVAAFRQAMGVPDDPSGYEITAEDALNLPGFDPDSLGEIKAAAHDLGLTAGQLKGLVAAQAKIEAAQLADAQSAEKMLINEWGDDYAYRLGDIAARVGDKLDLDQLTMDRADVLRALDSLAQGYREDSTGGGGSTSSATSLEEQIQGIITSEGYRNGTDKAARERLHSLYREQAARERVQQQ